MAHELEKIGALTGVSGELYGYLFENERFGIRRNVFWNLLIGCAPISYLGDTWEPSILVDWLQTEWLTEKTLSSDLQAGVEASLYIVSHDPAHLWSLEFDHDGNGLPRSVNFDLRVGFSGLDDDPHPDLRIVGSSPIKLTSLSVARDNFLPRPSSHADAIAMIAPHFPAIEDWVPVVEEDEDDLPIAHPSMFRFRRKS